MEQLDLFATLTCPCGGEPMVRDTDVILWCLCEPMIFQGETLGESMMKYQDWTASPQGEKK